MSVESKPLVVITGASVGIGEAAAMAFAKEGHPLLLISRNIEPLPALKDHSVQYAQVDVVDYDALEAAIRSAESAFGPTGCLINNAGFINIGDFNEMPIEKCHYEFDVLVKGVLNGMKAVLPSMSAAKDGTVINISSIADRKPFPEAVVYHSAKHAVRSMAESLHQAMAKNNVRVVNLAPGLIKTNIHKNMGITFEEYEEALGHPDFISPDEFADIIMFCWKQPKSICIRDMVVMPTNCAF